MVDKIEIVDNGDDSMKITIDGKIWYKDRMSRFENSDVAFLLHMVLPDCKISYQVDKTFHHADIPECRCSGKDACSVCQPIK